jgi:hypothetical protein
MRVESWRDVGPTRCVEPAWPGESRRNVEAAPSLSTEMRRAAPRLGEAAHQRRSEAKVRTEAAHAADAFRLADIA